MSETVSDQKYRLNIEQIRAFLPHRQPFLLVDRVLGIEPQGGFDQPVAGPHRVGTKVRALKNVTYNEPFFAGHFPQISLMPGVLINEMMAQTACFSLYPFLAHDLERVARDFQCILVGVDESRFRKPVVPGDTLVCESTVDKCRGRLWSFACEVKVEGQVVAEAKLLANMVLRSEVQ